MKRFGKNLRFLALAPVLGANSARPRYARKIYKAADWFTSRTGLAPTRLVQEIF